MTSENPEGWKTVRHDPEQQKGTNKDTSTAAENVQISRALTANVFFGNCY